MVASSPASGDGGAESSSWSVTISPVAWTVSAEALPDSSLRRPLTVVDPPAGWVGSLALRISALKVCGWLAMTLHWPEL